MSRTVAAQAPESTLAVDAGDITRQFLLGFIIPLSVAAGIADWACHRATDIEGTAGAKETLLHLLQLAEAGVPILAGLFLEITSPVLALMIVSFIMHEVTALLDMSYAETRRNVTPFEQHVHSYIEMAPLMTVALTAVLHRPQFLAMFGLGSEAPDLSIRLKRATTMSFPHFAAVAGGAALFEALLYFEELLRDLRSAITPVLRRGSG